QMDEKQGCQLELFFKTLNTSTVKVLFDLFKYLRNEKLKGNDVRVTWRAEVSNPDMLETGMDFSELFDLNFLVICA
ncbi:MAG: SiaC family regulatory phosphoprotein, partial [Marinoscillum sp.]